MSHQADQQADQQAHRLEAATAVARELLAEVHGTIKDLKTARREAEEHLRTEAAALVEAIVDAKVKQELDVLGVQTKAAMTQAVAKVGREFERLESLFLGTRKDDDRPSLEALIRARKEGPSATARAGD